MQKIIILLLVFKCYNLYCIKPSNIYTQLPSDYGLPYKDTMILTSDSAKLNVWIINQDSSKGTYLLTYGDAGNKSFLLYQAYYLYNQGFNIVMFDYRGFGTSSKFMHNDNFLYHKEYFEDFKTIYNYCKYCNIKLRIYALSMGTIFASRIETDSNDIHIYDSPVLNLNYAIKALKKHKHLRLKTPQLPNLNKPKNIVIFYGNKDYLINEVNIYEYTKNSNYIIYKNNLNHMESMNYLGLKYFDLISVL